MQSTIALTSEYLYELTMNVSLLSIVLCLISVHCNEWSRNLVLDPDGKYHVRWNVTGNDITFQIEIKTRGWVGFGISPNGEMTGSDVIIGWIANNRAGFHDRYAVGRSMPIIDEHQDWEFLWCCENDTHTTFRFKRPLITCDDQDLPIQSETTWLVYAYNDEDPSSSTTVRYHGGNRGAKPTLLFQPEKTFLERSKRNDPKDIQIWDVTSANVLIPHNKETSYYCTMFISPKLRSKHHVIRIEPLIQKGNERFVHHIILFKCSKVSEDVIYPFRLIEYTECYTDDQKTNFPFCQNVWAGWAVGGETFEFPDHVGMPLEVNYYRLEVHYENPEFKQGIYDNSGLRLVYTSSPRQYDSDNLIVGSLWHPCFFVPPNEKYFVTSGHAHPDCLRKGIQQEGIKVFAVSLQSHTIGKSITVRHFRGDEELPPIATEKNFDFNNQKKRRLWPRERTILPNDHLTVECAYDSTKRNQTTFGGLGTRQEICLAFLAYYPKLSIQAAISCPSPKRVLNAIGVTKATSNHQYVISPITGRNETYMNFLRNYPWDTASLNSIQYVTRYGPHISICSIGGNITVTSSKTTYPMIRRFYQEPDICANRPSTTKQPQSQDLPVMRPSQEPQTLPTEQPKRRKKIPQTIPYEFLDQIIAELG